MNNHNLIYRAVMAFFEDRSKYRQVSGEWPAQEHSGVYRYNAREYVVLRAREDKALAVFRVRPSNGYLRRLFNYPPALDSEPEKAGPLYKKMP